jgi:hypothetical protein
MKGLGPALLIAGLAAACTMTAQPTAAPPAPEASAPVPPPPLSPTPPSTAEPTAPAPTATVFAPFNVATWADNVLLRSNPGYLFTRLAIMNDGTALTVLGRSQGGEWLLVKTPANQTGWVFAHLVEAQGHDLSQAPVVDPADALVVRGHVTDANGSPVSGVQFALVQGSGSNVPRTDAMTDESGIFHAFMPPDTSGTWWVSYTAISCESNIMDASCNWAGSPFPEGVYVELPQGANSTLEFGWK